MTKNQAQRRLEYLRGEIQKECISYGEIAELQSLAKYIDSSDVELLQWAGVDEKPKTLKEMTKEELLQEYNSMAQEIEMCFSSRDLLYFEDIESEMVRRGLALKANYSYA